MIVDSIEDALGTLQLIRNRKTLLVPIFASPTYHVVHNALCAIYIYTEDDVERIISIRHTEQVRGFAELVPQFMALENIFVHDKKQWLQIGGNGSVWDINAIVPLQKHLEMCQKIRHYAWPMCMNAELTESYQHFDSVYPEVFA